METSCAYAARFRIYYVAWWIGRAIIFHIMNLSLEDAHHSAHNVTHEQDIIVDYLQVHFRFICDLSKSNHWRTERGVSLGLLSIKDVELCLGICIQVMTVVLPSRV